MDRSIPFYNLILRLDTLSIEQPVLPEGFFFQSYAPGDERLWAALEHEIGDFDSPEEAEQYFRQTYCPHAEALADRCWFVMTKDGECAGSCTAWWDTRGDGRVASLHWLVVSSRFRGKGLGRALCLQVLNTFARHNEVPVYIHTQPWSWKAVRLYNSLGFRIQKTDSFSRYENQFPLAMDTLRSVLTEKQFLALLTE